MNSGSPPIAVTIAGSDPSGGAGIQADIKTFSAFGVYGASVLTALTAQNTSGVTGVFTVPLDFIAQQFHSVVSDLAVSTFKTGMLGDAPTVELVAGLLGEAPRIPVVVDPVMVATSGHVLLRPDAIQAVRTLLIPRAALITPNLPEAARLLDRPAASNESEMRAQAEALMALGCKAVLIKGGHGNDADVVDILYDGQTHTAFHRPRIETSNTHGTGCTLSAAIAAGLAKGTDLAQAVAHAKDFVWNALSAGSQMHVGKGANGPIDHNFALRKS
jgi:hydroxymethylpyrimidine/phosphomethylpyrimidine kinase